MITYEQWVYNDRWKSDYLTKNNNKKLHYIVCVQVLLVPKSIKRNDVTLYYIRKRFSNIQELSKNNTQNVSKTLTLITNAILPLEVVKGKKTFSDGVLIKNRASKMAK